MNFQTDVKNAETHIILRHAQRAEARTRELVLEAPERFLDGRREAARAGPLIIRALRPGPNRAVRERDVDVVGSELPPNLRQRRRGPLRGEDACQVINIQSVKAHPHRQPPYELPDETRINKVVGRDALSVH